MKDLLRRLRAEAMTDLQASAGDLSMCAIAKSGTSFPAVRYHEGRVAMLRDLDDALVAGVVQSERIEVIKSKWDDKKPLAVLFGEVVLDDADGGGPFD